MGRNELGVLGSYAEERGDGYCGFCYDVFSWLKQVAPLEVVCRDLNVRAKPGVRGAGGGFHELRSVGVR